MTCGKSQHILIYQYLSVAAVSCADADCRDKKLLCDDIRDLCGDTLKDYCTGTCFLYFQRVINKLSCFAEALALYFEAAESVYRLWGKTEVSYDRDRGIYDSLYLLADLSAAFKLYSVCAALLDEPSCVDNSVLNAYLIGHERHIGNYESIFRTS